MSKKAAEVPADQSEPTEFPITLDEFLGGFGKKAIETRKAFAHLMKSKGKTGHKPSTEWAKLFELFQKKPTSVPWNDWVKSNEGGK